MCQNVASPEDYCRGVIGTSSCAMLATRRWRLIRVRPKFRAVECAINFARSPRATRKSDPRTVPTAGPDAAACPMPDVISVVIRWPPRSTRSINAPT